MSTNKEKTKKTEKTEKVEKKRQFNKIQLSGNLGADPEYSKEKEYFKFPLPVENSQGEKVGWINVVLFGEKAHKAVEMNLKKGSYVQVKNGRLKIVPWESDGKKGINVEIIAFEIDN